MNIITYLWSTQTYFITLKHSCQKTGSRKSLQGMETSYLLWVIQKTTNYSQGRQKVVKQWISTLTLYQNPQWIF